MSLSFDSGALEVALCHVFFNVFGVVMWGLIPITRALPMRVAVFGGRRAGNYRWWGFGYLIVLYFVMPIGIFGISLASEIAATGQVLQSSSSLEF